MALHPEVDSAVDEIVNEFVVSDNNDSCVDINLENLDIGAGIKKKVRDEFDYIKRLLNFIIVLMKLFVRGILTDEFFIIR